MTLKSLETEWNYLTLYHMKTIGINKNPSESDENQHLKPLGITWIQWESDADSRHPTIDL